MVNRIPIAALCIHQQTTTQWDQSLPMIQHGYNQLVHRLTRHSPFEVCYGYRPMGPYELPIALATLVTQHEQIE